MRHFKQIVYIMFLNKCLTSTTLTTCKLEDVALRHGKPFCFCYYLLLFISLTETILPIELIEVQ